MLLQNNNINCCFESIAVPDSSIEHGDIGELFEEAEMDSISIVKRVMRVIEKISSGDEE